MKKKIHPQFREVIFQDVSSKFQILTKSTVNTKQTTQYKGKSYPLVQFDVSSSSHPFYTGQQRLLDTEGRAEKFKKRYGRKALPVQKSNPLRFKKTEELADGK